MKKIITAITSVSLAACTYTAGAVQYSDTKGHWAEDIISVYSDRNIIQGSDGLFRPDDCITRGEFCVILDRIFKYENAAANTFKDLNDDFYTTAVLKANAAGVISGYENEIRPKDNITREEAAVMLCRAYDVDTAIFHIAETEEVSVWAVDAMYTLVTDGILSGNKLDDLRAGESITRAETLKIINGIENKYVVSTVPTEITTEIPTEVPTEAPTAEPTEEPEIIEEEIAEAEPTEEPTAEPEPAEEIPEENADENKNTATVCIEASKVGVDLITEPIEIEFNEGDTAAVVTVAALNTAGYTYNASGDVSSGFYLSSISGLDGFNFTLPESVKEYLDENNISYNTEPNEKGTLSEFDFTDGSGWMYFVNDEPAAVGMSDCILQNGDVITLKFTLDYGNDL